MKRFIGRMTFVCNADREKVKECPGYIPSEDGNGCKFNNIFWCMKDPEEIISSYFSITKK